MFLCRPLHQTSYGILYKKIFSPLHWCAPYFWILCTFCVNLVKLMQYKLFIIWTPVLIYTYIMLRKHHMYEALVDCFAFPKGLYLKLVMHHSCIYAYSCYHAQWHDWLCPSGTWVWHDFFWLLVCFLFSQIMFSIVFISFLGIGNLYFSWMAYMYDNNVEQFELILYISICTFWFLKEWLKNFHTFLLRIVIFFLTGIWKIIKLKIYKVQWF